jgi:hypothetical protein
VPGLEEDATTLRRKVLEIEQFADGVGRWLLEEDMLAGFQGRTGDGVADLRRRADRDGIEVGRPGSSAAPGRADPR